jgi:flagellar hook-associated protein 3 FlgL
MTRVTHHSIQVSTLSNLQRNLSAMGALQEQLSTQKRINRPSDDPTGTVSALQLRAGLRATEQHGRNADDGIGWLGATDSALQSASDVLIRAKVQTVAALNTGAQSSTSRAAFAIEVEGIRDDLVRLANTEYLGRSVFAGTSGAEAALTAPAAPGGAYTWAPTGTGTVERRVADDAVVRVDTAGQEVFGDGPTSVFALLDTIAVQIRTADPALGDSMAALDERITAVAAALSSVGARYGRLEAAQQAAQDRTLALTTSLSEVESIDLPATIVQLQSQEVAYKAALGATAKVLQPSLMDFLR